MKLVTITPVMGEPISVDPEHVVSVRKAMCYTRIDLVTGERILTKEPVAVVAASINAGFH